MLGVLWYNVYGTNDAYVKMGGYPYDNADRTYVGSGDDALLNQAVMRYQADRNALASIEAHYQTTGRLKTPLVTLHNILDPVVPYEHALLYGEKVIDAGASGLYTHIPAEVPYGHCNFSTAEIMGALTPRWTWCNRAATEPALTLPTRRRTRRRWTLVWNRMLRRCAGGVQSG